MINGMEKNKSIGLNPRWQEISPPPPKDSSTNAPILDAVNKFVARREELEAKVMIDELTGCWRRRYFYDFVVQEFDPNRDDGQIGIINLDINDLKKINDDPKLGHQYGDMLIINFVKYIKSQLRRGDEIIRVGGDEFIIICHKGNDDARFLENLKKRMQDIYLNSPQSDTDPTQNISFAYGVAVYDKKTDANLVETGNRADALMYLHKSQVKNQKSKLKI
jgi:diguanylate cyclase (GGDEF)-like protein